ncbi:MAG: cob(I)yrinic acid a,c-diamide adenosyltransferase [Acidimicrobiales bacterium]
MAPNETPPTEAPDKSEMRVAKSLVLVNTGHGKGKSSAAFGVAIRALAREWPTAVVQFLKSGDWNTGEQKLLEQLGCQWLAAGDGFTWESDDLDESAALARGAWEKARELIEAGNHRLLVLDEISYAMTFGWIDTAEVAKVVADRPEKTSIILTGRDMPDEIIEVADTVTSMEKVKHAFDAGIVAKKGIDY